LFSIFGGFSNFFFADTSQNELATTHAMFTLFEYNANTIDAPGR
jgi:hypothetical protein